MWYTAFSLIFVGLCLCPSDASVCQPYSTFKVDCNTCKCSANGREYSCTDYICSPKIDYDEKYDMKLTKEGYQLLVPKFDSKYTLDDGSDTYLMKKQRYPRVPNGYPYINDEIPPSEEDTGIREFEDVDDMNEETEDINNEVDKWDDKMIRRKQDIRK